MTSPEPAAPFLVPESDLVQEADDLPLQNEEAAEGSPLVNQGEEVQLDEREQSGEGAAEGAPGEVIRDLILGEAADQPSSPDEHLDNHPLLEPDWDQSGTEAVVQDAEEDDVQNSPPEHSTSRDSGRSRSRERVATADPIPVEGLGHPCPPVTR